MKIKCPTCGKRTTLPDGDVGMLALCSACGSSYRVTEPQPPPLPITLADIQASSVPQTRLAGWIALWVGAGFRRGDRHHINRLEPSSLERQDQG